MQRNPAINEMDDAAIEAEIDILFQKMEQGLAEMKRQRAQSEERWARIEAMSAETTKIHKETRRVLNQFQRSLWNMG